MANRDGLGMAGEDELTAGLKPDRLRQLLSVLFVLASTAAATYFVWSYRRELGATIDHLTPGHLAAASGLALMALSANFMVWREVLRGLRVNFALREGARVFFVSQLGKYLPGAVWPIVSQLEFARRTGVGRARMLAATTYSLAVGLTAGLVVGIPMLVIHGGTALQHLWWALLLVPPLCALLHPRVLPWMVDWGLRRMGRDPLGLHLAWSTIARAATWSVVSWVLFGLHLYSLVAGLGASGASTAGLSVGAFALGTVLGILFVPAPAGAGVRDVVLILTVGTMVPAPLALAAGLLSRAILTVTDLALAAIFGLAIHPSGRIGPSRVAGDQDRSPRR